MRRRPRPPGGHHAIGIMEGAGDEREGRGPDARSAPSCPSTPDVHESHPFVSHRVTPARPSPAMGARPAGGARMKPPDGIPGWDPLGRPAARLPPSLRKGPGPPPSWSGPLRAAHPAPSRHGPPISDIRATGPAPRPRRVRAGPGPGADRCPARADGPHPDDGGRGMTSMRRAVMQGRAPPVHDRAEPHHDSGDGGAGAERVRPGALQASVNHAAVSADLCCMPIWMRRNGMACDQRGVRCVLSIGSRRGPQGRCGPGDDDRAVCRAHGQSGRVLPFEASAPARDGDAVAGRSDPRGSVFAIRTWEDIRMHRNGAELGVLH